MQGLQEVTVEVPQSTRPTTNLTRPNQAQPALALPHSLRLSTSSLHAAASGPGRPAHAARAAMCAPAGLFRPPSPSSPRASAAALTDSTTWRQVAHCIVVAPPLVLLLPPPWPCEAAVAIARLAVSC